MQKLARDDLYSLEKYAEIRSDYRSKVIAHKRLKLVNVGPNATLAFEDRLTMQYQVQEMLRCEKIFESQGIEEELAAYNPLIPDGSNWKATFMIEFADEDKRQEALTQMIAIEDKVWTQVDGFDRVWATADEDMERENDTKTSAVHFLRFELSPEMVSAVKSGGEIGLGIDHEAYNHTVFPLPDQVRLALTNDLT